MEEVEYRLLERIRSVEQETCQTPVRVVVDEADGKMLCKELKIPFQRVFMYRGIEIVIPEYI